MKRIAFVIVVFFLSANMFAQIPGYLGKRFSIEYNNMFYLALSNPVVKKNYDLNGEMDLAITNFNFRNEISANYVISQRSSISVGFGYFRTRYLFDGEFPVIYSDNNQVQENYFWAKTPVGMISAYDINLHYTLFKKDYLAPFGKYYQFDFGLLRYKSTYDKKMLIKYMESYGDVPGEVIDIPFEDNKYYNSLYLGYSQGRKRVFYDKLLVNYGWQICFLPNAFESAFSGIANARNDNYFELMGESRVFSHMFFNLKLGVGLLIF